MTTETRDLTVNGPGSPYSLDKVMKEISKNETLNELSVLIENEGRGIMQDSPEMLEITIQGRIEQAAYFREQYTGKIPSHLYRYLHYAFDSAYEMKYPNDESLKKAFESGELSSSSEEYITIDNMIRYSEFNLEAAHLIGFILGFAGIMNLMRKMNKTGRIYIELPETCLHPKRQARFITMFHNIRNEYGPKNEDNSVTV